MSGFYIFKRNEFSSSSFLKFIFYSHAPELSNKVVWHLSLWNILHKTFHQCQTTPFLHLFDAIFHWYNLAYWLDFVIIENLHFDCVHWNGAYIPECLYMPPWTASTVQNPIKAWMRGSAKFALIQMPPQFFGIRYCPILSFAATIFV